MYLKTAILSAHPVDHVDFQVGQSVIGRAIEVVSRSRISVTSVREADLVIIFPYQRMFSSNFLGTSSATLLKRSKVMDSPRQLENLFRRILSIKKNARLLAISPENLERNPWTNFGDFLRTTNIPRLTSWPTDFDPGGFRFPYWWNFVRWPEIAAPRDFPKTRLGEWYELDALCSSTKFQGQERLDRAVWITNHLDFPRGAILEIVRRQVAVDILQNIPWGEKIEVLRRYKYCISSENSVGLGYETEKVPDALAAGCIPLGYIANPMGDFNPNAFFFCPPNYEVDELPALLNSKPTLEGLFNYVGAKLFS